ncbi:MAG: hypothetical protein RR060_07115, partial [Victivallaceae bacterium]
VGAILPGEGVVYTLNPSGGDLGASGRVEKLSSFLNLAPVTELFSRDLTFNGNKYNLKFMRLNLNLESLLAALQNRENVRIRSSDDTLAAECRLPDGRRERLVVLKIFSGGDGVFAFYALLPKVVKQNVVWPENLPRPENTTPVKVIQLSDGGTEYGEFKFVGDPAELLRTFSWSMRSKGYAQITPEAGLPEGRGEIFLRVKPYSMLLISVKDDGVGVVINRTRPVEK